MGGCKALLSRPHSLLGQPRISWFSQSALLRRVVFISSEASSFFLTLLMSEPISSFPFSPFIMILPSLSSAIRSALSTILSDLACAFRVVFLFRRVTLQDFFFFPACAVFGSEFPFFFQDGLSSLCLVYVVLKWGASRSFGDPPCG